MGNTATKMNYYALKIGNCEVGLDIWFNHYSELYLTKCKEIINEPNDEAWKWEVENKHKWMIKK